MQSGVKYIKLGFIIKEIVLHRKYAKNARLLLSHSDWNPAFQRYAIYTKCEYHFLEFTRDTNFSNFDFIFPVRSKDYKQICDRVGLDTRIIAPNPKTYELCEQKNRLTEYLSETEFANLLPIPYGKFPLIAKPQIGENSEKILLLKTKSELSAFKESEASQRFIIEAYVTGNREYALHVLMREGRLRKTLCIAYDYDHSHPVKNRDIAKSRTIVQESYCDLWESLLRSIHFEGICCINYKIDQGMPKLIEINPRIGGSMCEYLFSFIRFLKT